MRYFLSAATVAIFALANISAASAHRMWMLPSTFTLSGSEQWVTIDGAVSNDLFFPNYFPLPIDNITATGPDGKPAEIANATETKFRSVVDVKLDRQGTYKIAETGSRFFAQWKEGEETKRARGSLEELIADGIDKKEGASFLKSARSVETYVTLGAPTKGSIEPTGKGLEIDWITHPNDVYAGEQVDLRIFLDGKPTADIEVAIAEGQDRYRNDSSETVMKTDKDGRVSITPTNAGRYWLSVGADNGSETINGLNIEIYQSISSTFEALPN